MRNHVSLLVSHLYVVLVLGLASLPASAQGIITTVAGAGTAGFSGDTGPATAAALNEPGGIAIDIVGNLYLADFQNSRIRKVTVAGVITTVVGIGVPGFSGDGGLATAAQLNFPSDVEVDAAGNLYIADTGNQRIRKVTPAGIISTVAGNGSAGFSGDGAAATSAGLWFPLGVSRDPAGNLFIADSFNNRIRKVTPAGIISTVAGNGSDGFSGDGGSATAAALTQPSGTFVDSAGNLLIADRLNHRIRKVTPAGVISTVAGNGNGGYNADGGAATAAALFYPSDIVVDFNGILYIADQGNNRTRKVTPAGVISTVAGTGMPGFNGDGGPAPAAQLNVPLGVAVDGATFVYTADSLNHRIRKITFPGTAAPAVVSGGPTNPVSSPQTITVTARDADGAANIYRVYFLINNNSFIPQNTCHGFYDRQTNALYLYNDALNTLFGPLTPGTAGTLQNSQCSLNGSTSAVVSATGTDLVLNLGFSLSGSYSAFPRGIYFWTRDQEVNDTGWVQTGIWGNLGPPQPPTVFSATPANPTGSPQTFTLVARDSNGFFDINRVYFQVYSSPTVPANSCHGFYDRAANAFFLYNDAVTALSGPLTPGSAGTLQNSQCILNGATSTPVSGAGTDLTVTIGLSLQGAYAANQQRVYLWLTDNSGLGTGWIQTSIWNSTSPPQPPTVFSATPANPTGSPQTFTFVARDANGFLDINRVYFQVYASPTVPANTCHGFYDRIANAFYLYNDALTVLTGPLAPGSASTLQNGQCILNGAASTPVSGGGSDLTVTINLNLKTAYAANQQRVYLWVTDNAGAGTGWIQTSTWGTPTPPQPPIVVSGTPSTPNGSPQAFTFVARDANGFTDINRMYFQVYSSPTVPANSCHGFYDRAANAFFLYNDALTAVTGPLSPGSAGTLQNSQCVLNGAASMPVSGSGTDLTVTVGLSLQGAYAASPQKVYIWVTDNANTGTGWVQTSAWNSNSPPQPPTLVSAQPAATTSATQTFTLRGRDTNGFADMERFYFLVNTNTSIPAGSCHGFYDRASNSLFLYNDMLTALVGPLTPGAAGAIQNSQCIVNGSTSSVSASGTDLVLNLNLTRQGAYLGGFKSLYIWITDSANTGTGWVLASNWGF